MIHLINKMTNSFNNKKLKSLNSNLFKKKKNKKFL